MKKAVSAGQTMYEVYTVGPSGKRLMNSQHEDPSDAREQLKELKRLYGKYVQAGIDEKIISKPSSRLKGAVKQAKKMLARSNVGQD